jgi:fucose 4-O-acetylase-like acetyltransferase
MSNATRIAALDVAKGLAIFCVVVGHVVADDSGVPGAEWYMVLKRALYSFHMPLFMALSGLALGLSWRHRASWNAVGQLVTKRIRTLMVPYLVFGVVIVTGKLISQKFMHVDNPPEDLLTGISGILLYPAYSASRFLWYIQVLAMYFLVVPWLMQARASSAPWLLLATGLLLNQFEWTPLLNMRGVVAYLPFFAGGIVLGQYWKHVSSAMLGTLRSLAWCFPFALAIGYSANIAPLPKWLVGALSIPAVLSFSLAIRGPIAEWLTYYGNHTLSIYLLNTICIGLVKSLVLIVIPWRDEYFIVHFFILILAGLVLPVLIKLRLTNAHPSVAAYI